MQHRAPSVGGAVCAHTGDPRDCPREAARSPYCTDAPWPWYLADKTMGVFHLQSPQKKYDFTYEQAQKACAAEGASLATLQQLSAAQQVRAGMQRSGRGWLRLLVGRGHAVLLLGAGLAVVSP